MPLILHRVDARPIALARIFIGIAYLVCLLEVVVMLSAVAGGKLAYPIFGVLPAASPGLVTWIATGGLIAGVLLVLGVLSQASAALAFAVLVLAQLLDQQVYSNHLVLCTLLLAFLTFVKSGARWSIDARLRGRQDLVPWWPQLLMMTQVSICYLFAGLSKINSGFLSGVTLPEALWIEAPNGLFRVLAVATICAEVFIAVGVWLPRVRVLAVLVGVALHVSIVAVFDGGWVTFIAFGLLCTSTYWMFLVRPGFVVGESGLEVVAPAGQAHASAKAS